jgi:hypothetical protein
MSDGISDLDKKERPVVIKLTSLSDVTPEFVESVRTIRATGQDVTLDFGRTLTPEEMLQLRRLLK